MKNIIYRGYVFENYFIDLDCNVYSNKSGSIKPIKVYNDRCGYCLSELRKENTRFRILIHRAMYETFVGKIEDKLEVNHIDGNKSNNRLSNLEVVNRSENIKHAYNTGLEKKRFGEELYNIAISDDKLIELIIECITTKSSEQKISLKYNLNRGFLSSIFTGRCRKYIWNDDRLNDYLYTRRFND